MNTKINPTLIEKVKKTYKIVKTTIIWTFGIILGISAIAMLIGWAIILGDITKKTYNQSPTLQNVVNTPSKIVEEVKTANKIENYKDSIRKAIPQNK